MIQKKQEKIKEVFALIERMENTLTPIRFVLQCRLTQMDFDDDELELVLKVLHNCVVQVERLKQK